MQRSPMRHSLSGALAAGVLALLMHEAAAAPNPDAKITVGWGEPLDTINPATTGNRDVGPIDANIFDTLVWLTPDFKITPDLATKWELSPDGKTYTFTLRQDVTFHDGTPFDAAAVVANIDYITDKTTQSKVSLSLLGPCASAKATAKYVVEFTCTAPYAPAARATRRAVSRHAVAQGDPGVRAGSRPAPDRHRAVQLRQLPAQPDPRGQAQRKLQVGPGRHRSHRPSRHRSDHLPDRHQPAGARQPVPERAVRHDAGNARHFLERAGQDQPLHGGPRADQRARHLRPDQRQPLADQ